MPQFTAIYSRIVEERVTFEADEDAAYDIALDWTTNFPDKLDDEHWKLVRVEDA